MSTERGWLQVCEAELQRVPPALEGFLKGQFWSVMYMPQVSEVCVCSRQHTLPVD